MSLYRSILFAPANDLRKAGKALLLEADGVVLDLEDAVADSEKRKARITIQEALNLPRKGKVFVRVNSARSDFILGDLLAVVGSGKIDGIVLAKAESAEEVRWVDWLITKLEQERELPKGQLELVPFIESARAVLDSHAIASACPRVHRLFLGGIDYLLDIGASYSKEALFFARSQLVVSSRAAGIESPVDTVYPDFKDTEGLLADSRLARQLGFQGKLVIHPGQVGPVNEVFMPSADEIEWARKIVSAFEEAEVRGIAVIQIDGKMIEYPVVNRARQVLALASGNQK
ncbi:MAG: CoA ester lyase [Peptococcaceae bacterium]|nr:MAG: CoA ester lyase [Peptococcaceae bacterium]